MLEFKRSINNKSYLFCFLLILMSFAMGYFLLVGLDKIEDVTIDQLSFSVYTVMTQFGIMIYSVVIINSINQDYREQNVAFFNKNNVKLPQYLFKKNLVMVFWFSIFTIIIYTTICLIYEDFTYYTVMIIYYLSVLTYTVGVSSLCGILFKNILLAYGVCI